MYTNFQVSDFIKDLDNNCSKVQKKNFHKGEVITSYIAKRHQLCILLSGEAELVRYDYNGNKTIVEHFSTNDIFGEIFYTVTTNNELFVEAKENSSVLFFIYDDIKTKCKRNCAFHEKLQGYFTIISSRNMSKTFIIPFSLTDLADYLSIDRSAMMRELKSLKDEGFIEKTGNRITLLY